MSVLSTAMLLLSVTLGQGGGLAIGDPLPDFSLPGVDGKTHEAAEYADAKVLVVLFTCNHCPTAQAYEDRIIKLEADVRDRGVKLIAVSPNDALAVRPDELGYSDLGDSLEDMKIRAKERGFVFLHRQNLDLNFPNLLVILSIFRFNLLFNLNESPREIMILSGFSIRPDDQINSEKNRDEKRGRHGPLWSPLIEHSYHGGRPKEDPQQIGPGVISIEEGDTPHVVADREANVPPHILCLFLD